MDKKNQKVLGPSNRCPLLLQEMSRRDSFFFSGTRVLGMMWKLRRNKEQMGAAVNAGSPGRRFWWLLLVLLLSMAACTPPPPRHIKKRFFWPVGTLQPKIEYIRFIQTAQDLMRGVKTPLRDIIFGQEPPTYLFRRPFAVASDGQGRVFVTDVAKHKVFILDLLHHKVRTLLDPQGKAEFISFPTGVAVDATGRVYVVDSRSAQVIVFGKNERMLGKFGYRHLKRPTGITVDSRRKRVYVVDTDTHRLVVFNTSGRFLTTIGKRGSGPAQFNYPLDVSLDRQGNLYVLDAMNARVEVLDPEGHFLRAFGERGTASGSFQVPKSIAVSPAGQVYVTDSLANRLVIFDLKGDYLLTLGGRSAFTGGHVSPGGFLMPAGIDVDRNDTIWVVDSLNGMVHEFQYLDKAYLEKHPIRRDQIYLPPGIDLKDTSAPDDN